MKKTIQKPGGNTVTIHVEKTDDITKYEEGKGLYFTDKEDYDWWQRIAIGIHHTMRNTRR